MPNEDNAEELLGLLDDNVSTLTVVSGTAQQDVTGETSEVYVQFAGGASGTIAVAIGSTSSTTASIITAAATANGTVHFRLPANWFFKVTVAVATISSVTQVTGA